MSSVMTKRLAAAKKKQEEPKQSAPQQGAGVEQLYQQALLLKDSQGMSGGDLVVNARARQQLFARAGYDFLDARELTPNPSNSYAVEEGSIEALADLILESGNTTPIVVREVGVSDLYPHGLEIIDGERRWRAHLLLGERLGEHWYMIPARLFSAGSLSDEDALFILHAENVGQRAMAPSERARGVAAVTLRVLARRREDPGIAKGRLTREIVAEQLGISDRSADIEYRIGSGLCDEGLRAYDEGLITKRGAASLAGLPPAEQAAMLAMLKAGEIDKADLEESLKSPTKGKATSRKRDPNKDLRQAAASLRRALEGGQDLDQDLVAEIRDLLERCSL